ncbi:hypothetical protein [Aestuariispira insulae]|uniref:Uncharacterized protein n=1 Tax=Aestuariispira insulae TaxID=1461337 RepID=A0A3D9HK68_9PROT|nr:hypothetical protein [Aestuariispira insulae]RED49890.1 hypothetical protein DFP90_105263 [Aestuariispira insulae]
MDKTPTDKSLERQQKEERLAAKLRENLRRRKSQTRGRKDTGDDLDPGNKPQDS